MNTFAFDYDFIGFTFGDKHSINDLRIYRVSDGSRYNIDLVPPMTEKTVDIPGGDGAFYFGTTYKTRQFNINFAFDELDETGLRTLRQTFSGKEIKELSFDERPYVVYSAKVSGTPQIKAVCFDDSNGQRIYKGEGSVSFVSYFPYGHTPTVLWDANFEQIEVDGRNIDEYLVDAYPTKSQWQATSKLSDAPKDGDNPGDIPAPFTVTATAATEGAEFTIGDQTITLQEACRNLVWDSRSGLVTGTVDGVERPIRYTGNGCMAIPVDGAAISLPATATITYHYWYY